MGAVGMSGLSLDKSFENSRFSGDSVDAVVNTYPEAYNRFPGTRNKMVRPFRICFTVYAWRNVVGPRGTLRGT